MAKEYYSVKNQRIEFDTDRQTLSEPEFNSQYFRFKADLFSTMATQQSGLSLTQQDNMRIESMPKLSTFDDFIEMKDRALTILNSMIFASGSAE